MSTPILATKLYIPPPRPKVVRRQRLIERLSEGLQRQLALISAPAGFGKTTLVASWIADCRSQIARAAQPNPQSTIGDPQSPLVAWLSLDEGDNELARFLAYLVAALQTIAPAIGDGALAMIQSPQPPPAEATLTALLNDISAIRGHFALVLDDYHVIEAQPVQAALAFLIEHMPPQMHLVITTRADPPLPLARLRARAQLTELRASDLRFTAAEATGFLSQVMELDLAADDIAALEARTEGWAAGLQLAALSMRGRADTAQFVKAFAGDNRYVADYLVEEVLQRQPEHVRSFLLQTSILGRLSGPLCDAVLGVGGWESGVADEPRSSPQPSTPNSHSAYSQRILEQLERANLFVVPLDDQRHWFRYHHLFADMLAARALREQPAQVPIWHLRASAWYADNGMPAEAIGHALAAKDFARAAGLAELAWPEMDGRFQAATWLGWARAIPGALIRDRPVLCTAYAWALLNSGELEAAEAWLAQAARWLGAPAADPAHLSAEPVIVDQAQFQSLPASIATARAYIAQARGDIPGTVAHGRRALDLLPAGDHLRRGPAAALLGLAEWGSGSLDAAYRTLADAMAGFQQAGNLHFAISVTYGLADIRVTQGRLRDAIACYDQALRLALGQGDPPLRGTADLYLGLGELYREQGDRAAAVQHLLRSEQLGEQAALPDWRHRFCRAQARLRQTQGDLAGALELLAEADRHYHRTPVPDVRPTAALRARVWLAQGQLAEARRWAGERDLAADDELSFLREFEHITLARVLLAEHAQAPAGAAAGTAIRLLDRLQQAAEAGGRSGSAIEIAVLQALAHQAQGSPAPALAALERALRLAEPEGYVRAFADEGPAIVELLSAAAARGVLPGYVGKLLDAFPTQDAETWRHGDTEQGMFAQQPVSTSPTRPVPSSLGPPTPMPLAEPLSARELEVLRLIAQGLSNGAIGARLFLALSTVKGHNRRIFDKLEAQSRTEAIARARELGLL